MSYCRAIRSGSFIAVSGTTSIKDGKVFAPNDVGAQTRRCFEIINDSLEKLGATMSHVVRTRMFVTDISQWETIGKIHAEYFKAIPPATSIYEVKSLIDSELIIEIEVDAIAAL